MSDFPDEDGVQGDFRDRLDDHPFDDELDLASVPLKINDLVAASRESLSSWLDFVRTAPSADALKRNAPKIMAAIETGIGITGTEGLAMELASAVDLKFEQLGLWRAWYQRLMNLYGPATSEVAQGTSIKIYRCFLNYYLHRGDLKRASGPINSLLDLGALEEDDSLQQAMLGAATVAATLESGHEGADQAKLLLDLAELTDNKILLGRSYTVLAQFYANRLDWRNTFLNGQMVYSIGLGLDSPKFIPTGLHYMALSFQISRQPQRAFHYLKRAMAAAQDAHDASLQDHMQLTWGMCTYQQGNIVEAEALLASSVEAFAGPGSAHYHASALYAHGLALLDLQRYAESEARFAASLTAWARLEHPYEQLYSRHGLAEVYSRTGRHDKAIKEIADVLARAEKLGDRTSPEYLQILNDDMALYTQRRDQANHLGHTT